MLKTGMNLLEKKFSFKKTILKIPILNSILPHFFFDRYTKNTLVKNFIIDNFKKFEIRKNNSIYDNNIKKIYFYYSCRLFVLKDKFSNLKSLLIQFYSKKNLIIETVTYLTRIKTTLNRINIIQYIIHISDLISNQNCFDITSIVFMLKNINLTKKTYLNRKNFVYSLKFDF
jgi:hypothetical protein